MLTGKAFSKAVCGHFIVDSALPVLLTSFGTEELNALKETYAVTASSLAEEVEQQNSALMNVWTCWKRDLWRRRKHWSEKAELRNCDCKLYMHHITLVKDFIHAERTSSWQLHLSTVRRMLNLFTAAGHMNYARCGQLYLQLMTDLPHSHWLLLEFQKLLTGAYCFFYSFIHHLHATSVHFLIFVCLSVIWAPAEIEFGAF